MQSQQMADSFFGFDTSLGAGIDDGLDSLDDEEFGEENNYDALNDETFGSEATAGDWEQDHEKLAQIAESARPRNRNDRNNCNKENQSETEIDVENSLSHLVLDEKEVTIPRPGVWDSPTNFPIQPPQVRKPALTTALKNACTVEELERGLITNRPPPGLIKQPVSQPPTTNAGNLFLNSITSAEKIQQINGIAPPTNQFPLPILPPNVRLAHPQFHLPNVRPMPNHPANMFRYPMPHPMLIPPGGQRQPPLHGNFPLNNFPHPPNPGAGPLPFMRSDHPLMSPFTNNHQAMQHNLHMGNQRNQNKPFNHNDRQENHHQPFFRDNQFHHQNQNLNRFQHNQTHHGHHLNNQHHNYSTSNGIGPSGEQDEYAGLMNNREKQWLNNIQLLQLNTNQPYIDDYYYTVFCDRLNKKNENKNKNNKLNGKKLINGKGTGNNNNNNNNNGYHRDSRDREQVQHTFTTKISTTPMQFENSLGKLQYSSVTAPRKIIDMDVVPNNEPAQSTSVQQKDTKKTRQLLLEIERLYMLLLKLEDKKNPLAILADQQREQQQREQQQQQEGGETVPEIAPRDPVKEEEELILSILTPLLQFVQEDKFASLLSIRKGKTLFLRFLSCINVKEYDVQLAKLWTGVIKGLAIIGRRDSNLLTNFYTEFHKWVEENCISTELMNLAKEFIESANQPSKNNSLTFALTNKFGVSVISLMLKLAIPADDLCFPEYWPRFLQALVDSIGVSTPVVAPYELLDTNSLKAHLIMHGITSEVQRSSIELYFTDANPAR